MRVTIRRGVKEDADLLKALDTVVPLDPTRAERIDRWLAYDDVLVAEVESSVTGCGVYNRSFFHQGNVDMLMVAAAHRGQRVGEHLLLGLETLCDTPKLWVTTNLSNHRMQNLLRRLSYEPGGYIHELDPGDPELIFFKLLQPLESK